MILIAVLHLTRQREDLAGNLPSAFPGAQPFRPCQAPQVFPPSPCAGRAPQSVFRYSAHPSPWLTCSCICYPLFTYITPARAAVPAECISTGWAAQPLTLVHLGGEHPGSGGGRGYPKPPRQARRESREKAFDLCGRARFSTACHSNCLPPNVCEAVIYFAPYD